MAQLAPIDQSDSGSKTLKVDPAKDLWANIVAYTKDVQVELNEQTVLVCGSRGGGKTSTINRLTGSQDKVKPTTALEYNYGKREERNTSLTAHFWELAGGTELSLLSEVVLSPDLIHNSIVLLCVDCGDLRSMWDTMLYWLRKVNIRVADICSKLKAKNSTVPEKMRVRARKLFGGEEENHPDLDKVKLSLVPLVIVATRADMLPAEDFAKHRKLFQILRFIAHYHGASLVVTAQEPASEVQKLRALLNHVIFNSPFDIKYLCTDVEQGYILIPAGKDSFRDIGAPPPANMANFKSCDDPALDKWKAVMDEMWFPKPPPKWEVEEFEHMLYDTEKGAGDPVIDALRRQKNEELQQYKKNAAARKKEGIAKPTEGGGD
jgi:dynein light intermediate chain 2